MARLLVSIPLMNYGYPPISVGLARRADYYAAINKVCTSAEPNNLKIFSDNLWYKSAGI